MQDILRPLLRVIRLQAHSVISAAEFGTKLDMARVLVRDVGHADAIGARLAYLGGEPDIDGLRTEVGSDPNPCGPGLLRQYRAEAAALARDAMPLLHRVWDGPTRDALGALADGPAGPAPDAPDMQQPLLPGRIAAFANPSPPPGWADKPPLARMTVEFLHFLLAQTEIPTIELCCSIIHQFPDKPWGLTVDLAQQIADEVRHAQSCMDRIAELGGEVGQFPADLRIWRMTAPVGAELRLAIHQRIGEWIGVDALSWWASVFEAHGDATTGAMLRYMHADEVNHVGLGVRWLRRLAGDDDAVWALHAQAEQHRQAAGEDIGSRGRYPFDEAACRRAGLTALEIEHLRGLSQPRPA